MINEYEPPSGFTQHNRNRSAVLRYKRDKKYKIIENCEGR